MRRHLGKSLLQQNNQSSDLNASVNDLCALCFYVCGFYLTTKKHRAYSFIVLTQSLSMLKSSLQVSNNRIMI